MQEEKKRGWKEVAEPVAVELSEGEEKPGERKKGRPGTAQSRTLHHAGKWSVPDEEGRGR